MKNLYVWLLSLSCLFSVSASYAQPVDSTGRNEGIVRKIYTGAVRSIAWYDYPIAAADVAELLFVPTTATNKPITFPPTQLDTDLQPHVGVHGSQTLIGKAGDAGLVGFFGIRLLVNIGADLSGGDVTSEDYHRTFWFYKSLVYTYSITALAKDRVYRVRPDGSDGQSFFSGHSSGAFCAASYLSRELDDWYDRWEPTRKDDALRSTLRVGTGLVLYGGAAYVAYSRLHDQKHYFTDVAVGAAVGTIVGNLMYHWHCSSDGSSRTNVSIFIVRDTPTLSCTFRF